MSCPPWSELARPLLELAADGAEHRIADATKSVSIQLGLDEATRNETIPSGQRRIYNRMGWARTYLSKAQLLSQSGWGRFKITERGRALLAEHSGPIDRRFLKQRYSDFEQAWKSDGDENEGEDGGPTIADGGGDATDENTPEESIDQAFRTLNHALADDLLEQVKEMSPAFFERLVVRLIVRMGYGGTISDAGQALGKSGDGGIDGSIKEDRLGLDTIYLQAKRYVDITVGRPDIQAFVGALHGKRARKGIFITTSTFAQTARDYVQTIDTKVVLIDGRALARHMIEFGVGVATVDTYELKRLDTDFFTED